MKVLFFHPANYLEIGIPQGIAILSAILKREGHKIELFDTTFLKPKHYVPEHEDIMVGPAIYKKPPYTLEDLVKDDPAKVIEEEFQKKVDAFNPDLLAVSTMTSNYNYAVDILKKVRIKCPVIFGGIHPTLCPEDVVSENIVDIVCIGEGEDGIVELCNAIEKKKDYTNIKNLWIKTKDKKIIKNSVRPFVDLNNIPCPDWSLFDSRHLYRPFEGNIYVGSLYISSRGCPCDCTYCVNRTFKEMFEGCGSYFRFQKPETTISHLAELKKKYGATWFKFGDDTFLLQSLGNLQKLRDGLKPEKIYFGCSVRPNTINEEKVKVVKEMGCVAMSVGVETGNENIRRNVLNRQMSDKQIRTAFKIINDYGIRISAFNLIGLPEETREDVFKTIRFNKELNVKSANVYIVYPFPGSQISKKYKTNYKREDGSIIPMSEASVFHLSKMIPKEVEGLRKTFNLYLSLPEELWPIIKLAERNGKESDKIYCALSEFASKIV